MATGGLPEILAVQLKFMLDRLKLIHNTTIFNIRMLGL